MERTAWDHHGVVVADDMVAEYQEDVIRVVLYEVFTGGASAKLVAYPPSLPVETVVHRAMFLVGERKYGFLLNNCEHFASWCSTGDAYSKQVVNPTTFLGQFARAVCLPVWAAVNTALLLGEEPWDQPQYCAHCDSEHGWSEDASVVPFTDHTLLGAVRRELDLIRREPLASTSVEAREVAVRVRQTIPLILSYMDALDARKDRSLANAFAEAVHRVERAVVELIYEPEPLDKTGFQHEHRRLNAELERLVQALRAL